MTVVCNKTFLKCEIEFLKLVDADFAYWVINPRKPHNDGKEGCSLVEDDWEIPILDHWLRDMLELIRH